MRINKIFSKAVMPNEKYGLWCEFCRNDSIKIKARHEN